LGVVMAQLRHMVGAMGSDKTNIEYQQDVLSMVNLRQLEKFAFVIG